MADVYYYDARDSKAHADINTLHVDKECHHLSDARVYDVLYKPKDATICGTCGDPEPDGDSKPESEEETDG